MKNVCLRETFNFEDVRLKNFVHLTDEAEIIRKWRNNPKIRRWMFSDHIITPEEHRSFLKKLNEDDKNFYWLVENNEGICLGVVYLNKVDFKNKSAYLGVYSNPESVIKGKGQVLLNHLLKVAFEKANLYKVKLEVFEDNGRALSLYERNGFIEEDRLKKHVFRDGSWLNVIVLGLLNKNGS